MLTQINTKDVHRITSGQVIVDLLSIVKELVENSIDAHSDVIDITFKEHGLDSIEVNDNGDGINSPDFDSLCLKHYTSKLSRFEDLDTIKTLGFRGEALSSICANASVNIITSTKGQMPYSNELEYDNLGHMVSNEQVINKRTDKGTKITVKEVFKGLPVRHKNFSKNIKREFSKMLQFLYTYIIINPGIKFNVNNIVAGKKKNLIVTNKSDSLLNNFIIIYGTKSVESLNPISLAINETFKLEGYVSSISIGKGRSLKDKQFLYLNKRPIIHKEITKVINETYNTFNNLQFPVFVVNMVVSDEIDVNINPNKTLVNLNQDLNGLREKLTEYWGGENNHQQLNNQPLRATLDQEGPKPVFPSAASTAASSKPATPSVPMSKPSLKPKGFRGIAANTTNLKRKMAVQKTRIKLGHPLPQQVSQEESNVTNEITVKKLEFGEMELIGQFNLGFLLTRLHNNLFIVDQHASDEKHNYETLKHEFKVKNQLLIKPIDLNLNLIELNHLQNEQVRAVIEKNGFKLNDKNQITHLPIYKNIQFDETDLIELINQPTQILSKINKILAMKACRKSIMIGQHLPVSVMNRILTNLSSLDKPWNCPHGRPTIRYLHNVTAHRLSHCFSMDYQL